MRLLIIGASSYLGGHLRRQAAAAGCSVTTAGRSGLPGGHYRLDLAADGVEGIAGVITAADPDVVINCAGATTGSPEVLAAANITAVHALVTAMLGGTVRLVHIGSAAEYGGTEPGVPVTESAPVQPSSVYGVTKLAGTRLVQLARTAGLDAVVLRVFNAVGAGAPADGLPGQAAAQLRRALAVGGEVRLGPLDGVRDFVDVRDVAGAVLAAATVPALPHPVLNVGSGTGLPARVLVKELVAVSGYDGVVHEDAPGSARSAAMSFQQADITRARQDLGWAPRRDLAESVADLWEAAQPEAPR
ncbi:MAG: NAD(P)-dependent oxidoreductase [Streptosporangiaceae bacterium]|nr:NAD(P)-dependent oxidoreductase [Streptosporangiaceae bacterium]